MLYEEGISRVPYIYLITSARRGIKQIYLNSLTEGYFIIQLSNSSVCVVL